MKQEQIFNKKVQDCNDKGYLVEPIDFKGDLEGVKKLPHVKTIYICPQR